MSEVERGGQAAGVIAAANDPADFLVAISPFVITATVLIVIGWRSRRKERRRP